MACGVAVKRSLDSYISPDAPDEPITKRSRTAAHCSPFRASFGTMAASLPASSSSPFNAINTNLTSDQLESYLMAEVKYLRRRRLLPRRRDPYRTPHSPQHSSDSEGENQQSKQKTQSTSATQTCAETKKDICDTPQFTLNQDMGGGVFICKNTAYPRSNDVAINNKVRLICERLLQEQEARLRNEYELVLNQKLTDQYDTFCKFTQDQIRGQINHKTDNHLSC